MMMIERTKYMSADEVTLLRMSAQKREHSGCQQDIKSWMLVDFALATGLRVSEIAAVQVEDLDLARGLITVIRVKRRHKRPEVLGISPELCGHLAAYLQLFHLVDGALWRGQRGPLTAQGLQRMWKRAVKLAGLPPMSIHSARHTIAVHLLKKTGNLRQVQKQLGHASPATTANMYADIPFEDMVQGVTNLYAL
jgi:integrase